MIMLYYNPIAHKWINELSLNQTMSGQFLMLYMHLYISCLSILHRARMLSSTAYIYHNFKAFLIRSHRIRVFELEEDAS